jgi:hypothetical protein
MSIWTHQRRREFSQPHWTPAERKAQHEALWASRPKGAHILSSYPPWYYALPPRDQSRTPDLDEAFLTDRRDAGDIIVDDLDGGNVVFPIGTPQSEIDWQMAQWAKMRSERRAEVPPPG